MSTTLLGFGLGSAPRPLRVVLMGRIMRGMASSSLA